MIHAEHCPEHFPPVAGAIADECHCADQVDVCPACGEPGDYCQGHGEIGDPAAYAVCVRHDDGDHADCHPAADCHDEPSARACAECGTTTALTYVVTRLEPDDPTTETEVCRACDDEIREG